MTDVKVIDQREGKNWVLYHGDSVRVMKGLPDNSLDLTVSSPPFSNLYIYSDDEADMGNSADDEEFFKHYEFVIKEMYRATRPGRLNVVHCKDMPAFKNRDGSMGLIDFPGKIIRAFEAVGWQYHSRVTIWKDPVVEMERTKNNGLLHRNFVSSTEQCRQGMPDYLIVFRKWPVEGGIPVIQNRVEGDYIGTKPPEEWELRPNRNTRQKNYSISVWQRYASPVWFDIRQTYVLNDELSKDPDDVKHICPLQRDVIQRCIDLWSNKGEVIFDPFSGVGSTAYEAVRMGRRGVGIELKESYWKSSIKFCEQAEIEAGRPTLFDLLEAHEAAGESAPAVTPVAAPVETEKAVEKPAEESVAVKVGE